MNISALIKENLTLKQELTKVKGDNLKLVQVIKRLEIKNQELLDLPVHSFNLDQFKNSFLKNEFDFKTMPRVGGIYAYYNHIDELLYIGQSVNMGNRLKQHFRNGKIKVNGHDSEFSSEKGWKFYVLEYIDRSNKTKLDEREAYWIAMGKVATSNKTVIDNKAMKTFKDRLATGQTSTDLIVSSEIEGKGNLTNRTRGNGVRM